MPADLARRARKGLRSAVLPILLLTAGAVAAPMPAMAQSESGLHGGTLEVPLNKSQVVTADRAIDRAMIGNPEIADIVPLTDRSIYVLGKSMGATSLTLYDRSGRVLVVMDVAVGPDAAGYREQLSRLVPGNTIEAQTSGKSLILTGMVNDPGVLDRAVQLAKTYAGNDVVNMVSLGATQQVMLEVKFAEVKRGVGNNIGVRTAFAGNNNPWVGITGPGANLSGDFEIGDGTVTGTAVGGTAAIANSFGILGRTFSDVLGLSGTAVLDALEEKGFAKTLAEPTLVALSGEKASFLAGGEFPVPVVQ